MISSCRLSTTTAYTVCARNWGSPSKISKSKLHFKLAGDLDDNSTPSLKKAVVVGGGWAGFGACHQLLKDGFEVTLVDGAAQPGGLSTGFRTKGGRSVEAGIKGFWFHYYNIYALVEELGIPDPFTDWTQSAFWSPAGIQVEAPVLQDLLRLPAPLGTLVYTSPYFRALPVWDRLSALPLIFALLEYDADQSTYNRYDRMTARELFRDSPGVSSRLYDEFLGPMLLVLMFAPGECLSAAAALDVFYTYILAHQPDFDVRWCRGSIAELIFSPWVDRIKSLGGKVVGSTLVERVEVDGSTGSVSRVVTRGTKDPTQQQILEADVVVLAVGCKAAAAITRSSPALAEKEDFTNIKNLQGVDVMAVRVWFDRRVRLPNASNIGCGFDPETGFTFYNLNTLQDEYKNEKGSVIEIDFYNAGILLPLDDDKILRKVVEEYLGACVPAFKYANVIDSCVLRFKGAVTGFSPGSSSNMPLTLSSVPGIFFAGDWIRQGPDAPYGQRGLSQEKALVSGRLAAEEARKYVGLGFRNGEILGMDEDEIHIGAAKTLVRSAREMMLNSSRN